MHNRLEQYLTDVAGHLSPLPVARRNEELREMRAHLLHAVAVHRAGGKSEDEAARAAVEQFGTPEAIGQGVVASWRRAKALSRRSQWGAAACTLALWFFLPTVVDHLILPFELNSIRPGWSFSKLLAYDMVICTMPTWFVMGIISGLLHPKRAVAGAGRVMAALLALHFAFNLFPLLTGLPFHMPHWPVVSYMNRWHVVVYRVDGQGISDILMANYLQWIILAFVAVFGAWAGSRWRERHRRPVRA